MDIEPSFRSSVLQNDMSNLCSSEQPLRAAIPYSNACLSNDMLIQSEAMEPQQFLTVADISQVAEARRLVTKLGARMGLDETEKGRLAIVATEIATNLIKHAEGGLLLLRALGADQNDGIEILAIDKGPGIVDLAQSIRDGYSTAGTPGGGLGAIYRLSKLFDLYSVPTGGTVLLSRASSRPSALEPFEIGVVCLPKPGEEVCGDSWDVAQSQERSVFLVADGLGHGPLAAEAGQEAIRIFRKNLNGNPAVIVEALHAGLRSTRGAVLAVVEIDGVHDRVCMAGVGNISVTIQSPENNRRLVSLNGTVGCDVRKIREFASPWPEDGMLIMHSDGLETHWNLRKYPGLASRHPGVVAGTLYRDHCRGNDDITVLVAARAPLPLHNGSR